MTTIFNIAPNNIENVIANKNVITLNPLSSLDSLRILRIKHTIIATININIAIITNITIPPIPP